MSVLWISESKLITFTVILSYKLYIWILEQGNGAYRKLSSPGPRSVRHKQVEFG